MNKLNHAVGRGSGPDQFEESFQIGELRNVLSNKLSLASQNKLT